METPNNFNLNYATKQEFLGTIKWAKFLSIMGFIFSVLIVMASFSIGAILENAAALSGGASPMPSIPSAGITGIYLFMGLLYFVPSWFLFQFARQTKNALTNEIEDNLTEGIANLRRCFKFMGILTIIMLAIYLLIIIAVAVGMAVGGSMM